MAYYSTLVFIETHLFTKTLPSLLTDEEFNELQNFLMQNPEAGKLIRGSGGIRKLRWGKSDKGKSSGIRIIYTSLTSKGWVMTKYFLQDKIFLERGIASPILSERKF